MFSYFSKDSATRASDAELRAALVDALKLIDQRLALIETELMTIRTATTIRVLDFELRRDPRYSDPLRLHGSAAQVCSQNGEDGMIAEIFRRIGTGNRVFAEIGVGDGNENNTAYLLAQGWKGYWLDGDDQFAATLRSRPDIAPRVTALVGFLTRENVDSMFAKLGVPEDLDLLSLDVDQNTYYLWEGLRRFKPRVVVVEYNATVPPDVVWKVRYDPQAVWDQSNNFGASLAAYEALGRELGYSLVGCDFIGTNAFFVRSDLTGDRFAAPFTAANHYEPPRYELRYRRGHMRRLLDAPA